MINLPLIDNMFMSSEKKKSKLVICGIVTSQGRMSEWGALSTELQNGMYKYNSETHKQFLPRKKPMLSQVVCHNVCFLYLKFWLSESRQPCAGRTEVLPTATPHCQ